MKSRNAKLIRVALLYGSLCLLAHWGLSILMWRLFPDRPGGDELTQQIRWAGHTVTDKVLGLVLLSVTAFFASRSHHPSWRLGVATGIAAAMAYQLTAVLVYVLRFGSSAYQEYHDFVWTILWTVGQGWFFGYVAVRRQYLHDKHAVQA